MVKVTGPMMSMSASGTLGQTLTFARRGGTAYVRQHVIPHNPKTAPQTGNRAMWRFLSQNWAAIPQVDKDTWAALAASKSGQNFNAYMAKNQTDWKQFLTPEQTYPRSSTGTPGTVTLNQTQGSVGQTNGILQLSVAADNWGAVIHRSATPAFTPSVSNCVLVILANAASVFSWVDTPVAAGTWHYQIALFTDEGIKDSYQAETTATVT